VPNKSGTMAQILVVLELLTALLFNWYLAKLSILNQLYQMKKKRVNRIEEG
jgi:hypothetical protein